MIPRKPETDFARTKRGFATVGTFMTESDANLAKAAGIYCIMRRDDCGGLRPSLTFTEGIEFVVSSADAKRAAKIFAT